MADRMQRNVPQDRIPRFHLTWDSPLQPDSLTVVNDVKRLDIGDRFAEVL